METYKHYRIGFKNYEIFSGHVEYIVTLICETDDSINVEFKDRYSSLKDLHEALKKEANSINFPKFPPKKLFGNLDEKFLNERKIKLQHYFNTILGSKDFSQLKSLNKWIEGLIKNHNKSNKDKEKIEQKQSIHNSPNIQSQQNKHNKSNIGNQLGSTGSTENPINSKNQNDIVDKYSEKFIDLGNDPNPHYDNDEVMNKENIYKNLIETDNNLNLNNSNIFRMNKNKTDYFDFMGLEENKMPILENLINERLKNLSNYIKIELPKYYIIQDLIVS